MAELEAGYEAAIELLRQKEATSGSARDRARQLLDRANGLTLRANGQVEDLRGQSGREGRSEVSQVEDVRGQ